MKLRATYAYSSQLWEINHLQVANLISKQYTELILLKNNPENIKILKMVRYMYERTKRERKKGRYTLCILCYKRKDTNALFSSAKVYCFIEL